MPVSLSFIAQRHTFSLWLFDLIGNMLVSFNWYQSIMYKFMQSMTISMNARFVLPLILPSSAESCHLEMIITSLLLVHTSVNNGMERID